MPPAVTDIATLLKACSEQQLRGFRDAYLAVDPAFTGFTDAAGLLAGIRSLGFCVPDEAAFAAASGTAVVDGRVSYLGAYTRYLWVLRLAEVVCKSASRRGS